MIAVGRFCAHLVFVVAAATSAFAADSLKLKNGTVVKGRATAYDSGRKVLSFRTEDGKDTSYTLDQLDQRSVYLVNSSLIAKDNARGQLQLANYARDVQLFYQARRAYDFALKADPSLKPEIDKELALGRKMAAEFCMKNAQDAIAKKKIKDAEEWLTTLVQKLPNEPQADQAATMLEQYYASERNARDDELEAKYSDLLQKDLKKGKETYDRMIERTKEGLTARSDSKASSLWKSALDDGETVLKEIDRLVKKYPDDPKIQDGAVRYRELTIAQLVDVHLHLASSATVKSSYKDAMRETNAALALDPNNSAALAQRARIEQASSQGLGLNWF
jgi:hypothetical protein